MYIPSHFEETRAGVLHELMIAHPLGTLVTVGGNGINANHVPFELDPDAGQFGTLRAHVARGNPVWRDFSRDIETLVIFQGASAYISPSWYPGKQVDGKVVPTWNYMVVHAYGTMRVIEDPVWLRGLLDRLTARHESNRPMPWQIGDAPEDYIDKLLGAIVGIEIPIARLQGKWKVSQNRSDADRAGVTNGLIEAGGADAAAMAEAVSKMY